MDIFRDHKTLLSEMRELCPEQVCVIKNLFPVLGKLLHKKLLQAASPGSVRDIRLPSLHTHSALMSFSKAPVTFHTSLSQDHVSVLFLSSTVLWDKLCSPK